jgi:hypothetical protein
MRHRAVSHCSIRSSRLHACLLACKNPQAGRPDDDDAYMLHVVSSVCYVFMKTGSRYSTLSRCASSLSLV